MNAHIADTWETKGWFTSALSLFFLLSLIAHAAYSTTESTLPRALQTPSHSPQPVPGYTPGGPQQAPWLSKFNANPFFMGLQVGSWLCEGGYCILLDIMFSDKDTCSLQWAKGFSHCSLSLWLVLLLISSWNDTWAMYLKKGAGFRNKVGEF